MLLEGIAVLATLATGVLAWRGLGHGRREAVRAEPMPPVSSFALGDALVFSDGRDAWLAGRAGIFDGAEIAELFFCPGTGAGHVLYLRRDRASEIVWAHPVVIRHAADLEPTIEHGGERFVRRRRLPVDVRVGGEGVPFAPGIYRLGDYSGELGRVLIVLHGSGVSYAWRGQALPRAAVARLEGERSRREAGAA